MINCCIGFSSVSAKRMIVFTNLSGAAEIGANSYLLDIDGTRIVLDAGVHPKKEGNASKPRWDLIEDTAAPEAVFVSHAHLDHIGALPVLQEAFPRAEVHMTVGTAEVGKAMLHNSVNVMSSKRMFEGIAEYPFFTHGELERASAQWLTHPCEAAFRVGYRGDVLATMYDAGHILGSCGVMLEALHGETVFYTGDVQFEDQSILRGASFPQQGVDILIMECTHGATERDAEYTREREMLRFAKAIRETLEAGGAVLIPVFALGKSQELLYEIGRFRDEGLIPDVPIFFGGLGAKICSIYDRMADDEPLRLVPGMKLRDQVDTVPIPRVSDSGFPVSPGNIYLVSSGMMSPHTLSNRLAAQLMTHPKNALLIVGYSDPDSPAGRLREAHTGDLVRLGEQADHGQAYPLQCRVECFDFSGHAARTSLLDYAQKLAPRHIVLVHGDEAALEQMRDLLQQRLPRTEITIPQPGVEYLLAK